jgi:PAS domain-containing protein
MSVTTPEITTVPLDVRAEAVFGSHTDPMPLLAERARELLADREAIVWEADAKTFVFSYVNPGVEAVLGYPASRWTEEPTFWADVVLHPNDREESVTYCATETGKGCDHDFEYRAVATDGRVVRLRDYVRVVPDAAGKPARLRGVMVVM